MDLLIIQNSHKNTFDVKYDNKSSKIIAKPQGVTLYMVTPGGQIPILGLLIIQNSHKNTFDVKCDNKSSKVIAKRQGVTLYTVTPVVKEPFFAEICTKCIWPPG